jgi:hypothetical protein
LRKRPVVSFGEAVDAAFFGTNRPRPRSSAVAAEGALLAPIAGGARVLAFSHFNAFQPCGQLDQARYAP